MAFSPSPARSSPDQAAAPTGAQPQAAMKLGFGDTLKKGSLALPGIALLLAVGYAGKLVTPLIPHTE